MKKNVVVITKGIGKWIKITSALLHHVGFFSNFLNLKKNFICRIVGDDDGGELMTPEEFEEYKKKVLPMVNISALAYFINELSVRNTCF